MKTFKTATTQNKVKNQKYSSIFKVNHLPFKWEYEDRPPSKPPYEHTPRTHKREGARFRGESLDPLWEHLHITYIKNDQIIGKPIPVDIEKINTLKFDEREEEDMTNHRNDQHNIELERKVTLIKFRSKFNDEPIIHIDGPKGKISIYIDTGAQCDLVPLSMLQNHFPGVKKNKSQTKLVAANDTYIPHRGTAEITLPFPGEEGREIQINPFITPSSGDENVMILGYKSLEENSLVPIPGEGLLQLPVNRNSSTKAEQVLELLKNRRVHQVTEHIRQKQEEQVWEARPVNRYFVPAYKRTQLTLTPKEVPSHIINSLNGVKVLVRTCACVFKTNEECIECLTDPSRVQICNFMNGAIQYTYDNTYIGYAQNIDQKTKFFFDTKPLFNLPDLAKSALDQLEEESFEVNAPVNPYTEEECEELFQKTREQVTKDLRSIIAEPASWSITGHRPATIRVINSQGQTMPPNRKEGPKLPINIYKDIAPCKTCKTQGEEYYCNIELPECTMRKFYRHKTLPNSFESTIKEHNIPFTIKVIENLKRAAVIGCHRKINGHSKRWNNMFDKQQTQFLSENILVKLVELANAPITEVSKSALMNIYETINEQKIEEIYFTNFEAFGISRNLLQRIFANKVNIHVFPSTDIKTANAGFDPRKNTKAANINIQSNEKLQTEKIIDQKDIKIEPGLPRCIEAHVVENKTNEANILTNDENLKNRCKTMLETHNEIFAKHESESGQFCHPETKEPFLFHLRLKNRKPNIQKSRFVPPARREAATELISALLANNIIRRRWSYNNAQSVYVPKKRALLTQAEFLARGGKKEDYQPGQVDPLSDIKLRHCVDFSETNVSIQDTPVASLSPKQMIGKLEGAHSLACLDLASAYHALTLDSESELVSGFESGLSCYPGKLTYRRAGMGLKNSSAFLAAALDYTLTEARDQYIVYADDLIIFGKSNEQVLERLSSVLDLLTRHGWKIKKNKLVILATKLTILGQIVDLQDQTVTAPRASLDAVLMRPRPQSKLELKKYLGSVAWFGEVLLGHAESTATLQRMCRGDHTFQWTEKSLSAYESLQELFSKPSHFNYLPSEKLKFHIVVDSSEYAAGYLLCQITPDKQLRVIGYHSHLYDERTSRLSAFERESHAAMFAIHSYIDIIRGRDTVLWTDSRASCYITAFSKSNSKVSRWNILLSSMEYLSIAWLSSKTPILQLADYLSRCPAGSRQWKNKQLTTEDEVKAMTLASQKLKRDTVMTMTHHRLLMDWLCSQPEDQLKQIEDNSIYITDLGEIKYTNNTEYLTRDQHILVEHGLRESPEKSHSTSDAETHPAFQLKKSIVPKIIPASDMLEEENVELKNSPQMDHSTVTETGNVQKQNNLLKDEKLTGGNLEKLQEKASPLTDLLEGRLEKRGRINRNNLQKNKAPIKTIYSVRKLNNKQGLESPMCLPHNVLEEEEAEELGVLGPASEKITGPEWPEGTFDHPRNNTGPAGKFLQLCFEKSPFMRLQTLKAQQSMDPYFRDIIKKCKEKPILKDGGTYFLHEGILLRKHGKEGIINYQVAIPGHEAYTMVIRLHHGTVVGGWRRPAGAAPHHGSKKLQTLISQRFFVKNLKKLTQ